MKLVNLILKTTIVVLVILIATSQGYSMIFDLAISKSNAEYQEEIIYPQAFYKPSDAMRVFPFSMPANLVEQEYVPPVYDIVNVKGIGKLVSGAEIALDAENNYSIIYNGAEYTNLATAVSNIQDDVFPCSKEDFVNLMLAMFDYGYDLYFSNPAYSNDILFTYVDLGYTSIYDIGIQDSINGNEDTHEFLTEHFENTMVDFEITVIDSQNNDAYHFYVSSEFILILGDNDREYQVIEYDFTDPIWYSQEDYQAEATPLFEFGGSYSVRAFENIEYIH